MIERLAPGGRGIEQAAQAITRGELVAFPTETVYGLGADACNDDAVAQIFAAKGRPADHPLIVHVVGCAQAADFAVDVPEFAHRLMAAFWPGPLTLILPRRSGVATASAGGQSSIGLRSPSHPMAQALLHACAAAGVHGVSAPSANPFGRISPTAAVHVAQAFATSAHTIHLLDGGACDVGIESTIVDCTRGAPVLLRPGMLSTEQLAAAAGQRILSQDVFVDAPRASGSLAQHYAPKAKVRLMAATDIQAALDVLGADAADIAVYARSPLRLHSGRVVQRRMPDDAASTAQQLFAVLHAFDAEAAKLIWVEAVPTSADWDGVRDRLQRAAA